MSNNKLKKRQARLFSTLASIERTDESATKRRKQSHLRSLQQSRAASDQAKLNGILLELRILTQRCLTEQESVAASANVDGNGEGALGDGSRVKEEVDVLLENLLVARRELMGHQLDDNDDAEEDDDEKQKRSDVDYAALIKQANADDSDETSSSDEDDSSDASSDGKKNNSKDNNSGNLTKQLQSEYASLRNHWKSTLNKHHSNLALHSGMTFNSSKFQSKAVDVSFWEQVEGGMEHDKFKQRAAKSSASNNNNQTTEQGKVHFDDSKLYQQMLKDFISSSQTNGSASSGTNKRGLAIDPAQEAAERLKRAMRKKGAGDNIDLTSLLTDGTAANSANDPNGLLAQNTSLMKKKALASSSTVDRRASKGRKIRYTVHPKLVNFTFPVSRPEPMIKEDVWFKSLFGGVGNRQMK